MGRRCVGVKGRVPFPRAFYGDPGRGEILKDPTRWCTPTLRPDLSAGSETVPRGDRGLARRHNRVTRAAACVEVYAEALDGTGIRFMVGQGDQRIYQDCIRLNPPNCSSEIITRTDQEGPVLAQ